MSAAPQVPRAAIRPEAAARPPAAPSGADPSALASRLAARLGKEWLPRAAWTIGRTGRPGLLGIALLVAAAVFLVTTHLPVASEVEALRAELAAARGRAPTATADEVADPAAAISALPARADMPRILRELFDRAAQARLAVDTGKYEVNAAKGSRVVRYRIAFPVKGSYPQIRGFIDATLAAMPAVALDELVLERKSIGAASVEAQIRMTVYTRSDP